MKTLIYDGSFEGLFTAIFDVYEYKFSNVEIVSEAVYSPQFFSDTHLVFVSAEKADRVLKKLDELLGYSGMHSLFCTFLSEDPQREMLILHAVQYVISTKDKNVLSDFSNPKILEMAKLVRSVGREKHRMEAFVRFEKLQDDFYFSKIEPDFDVLPLIKKHFEDRFQDQKWIIYDLRRKYALVYDLVSCDFFRPEQEEFSSSPADNHETEDSYQKLWQTYFFKTNIKERANTRLHVQHVPKRYWKYLTEKKIE